MALEKEQITRLFQALLSAYPTSADLEQMLRFGLGENLEEVVSPGPLKNRVFDLIRWAETHGRVPDLVRGALSQNAGNPELKVLAEEPWAQLDLERTAAQERRYLERVAQVFGWIDLGGLAPQVGGELLRLPLDEVFVHLRAERDVPLAEEYHREELRLRRELEAREASAEEIDRELERLAHRREKGAFEAVRRERVTVGEALRAPRMVVLGDPGAGKTTFLRYLARVGAVEKEGAELLPTRGLLPVYLRLGEYDRYLDGHPHATLREYLPVACATRELPLPPAALDHRIGAGTCLFLLDGLDEIVHTGRRQTIRERVEQFARAVAPCRLVVTSRIVGSRDAQLSRGDDGFQHFTLCPFEDEEISRFAEKWYAAIRATGDVTDPERQNAAQLTEGIRGNPGVRRLATNPLLLTLIALIYWRECTLPRRRVDLYRMASQALISKWVRARTPGIELGERETTSLLMAVAFRMHSDSSAGVIGRPELERVLVEQKTDPRRGGMCEAEAEAFAERFLKVMGEHVGILFPRGFDERGHEVYGFLHLTFEEYFAARELARLWKQGKVKLKRYLNRPRWEEPLLLACAHLSDEDDEETSDRFVREIFEAGSPYEKELHRDLFFAVRCLGEDAVVFQDLQARLLWELHATLNTSISALNKRIVRAYGMVAASGKAGDAIPILLRKLESTSGPGEIRKAAAQALEAVRNFRPDE